MAAEAKSGFPRHPSLDRPYYIKGEIDRLAMDMRLENDTLRSSISNLGHQMAMMVAQNSEKIKKINERMVQGKAKDLAQSMAGGRKRKRRTKKRKSRKKRTKRRKKRTKRRR